MRTSLAALTSLIMMSGCVSDMESGGRSDAYYRNGRGPPQGQWRNYDHDRPDPQYGNYDAGRYYRQQSRQQERRLNNNERVYRGQDGRYYCRRSDGSTGLIVGAIAGGVLGNVIAPGRSDTLGTILGAIAGGAVGNQIDRNNVRCR